MPDKREKALMAQAVSSEGFQLLMVELNRRAVALNNEYDRCTFANEQGIAKAMKIQATREVILDHIPQIVESIITFEDPKDEPKSWSFISWLKSFGA